MVIEKTENIFLERKMEGVGYIWFGRTTAFHSFSS
jgi:hypothetical protein